jgi:hypothetical protein
VFNWGEAQEKPLEPCTQPEDEPTAANVKESLEENKQNVEVKKGKKVPEKKDNPVQRYCAEQLTVMKEMFGISETKEVVKKFAEMRKALIDAQIIPDIKSDEQTMEQAEQMFDAIYANFKPNGERK